MEQIKVSENFVLIELDGPNTTYKGSGLVISDEYEPFLHLSTFGTVVAAPERVVFNGSNFLDMACKVKVKSGPLLKYRRQCFQIGTEYDTEVEISKGDRVFFNHIHNVAADESYHLKTADGKRFAVIPYAELNGVVDSNYKILRMLNGFVMVRPVLKTIEHYFSGQGMMLQVDDDRMIGQGVVVAISKNAKRNKFISLPSAPCREGDHVFFKMKGVRVETKRRQEMNKEGVQPLLRLEVIDIIGNY